MNGHMAALLPDCLALIADSTFEDVLWAIEVERRRGLG
jgi:hypothetical protein